MVTWSLQASQAEGMTYFWYGLRNSEYLGKQKDGTLDIKTGAEYMIATVLKNLVCETL